jgi:hypothetical protein
MPHSLKFCAAKYLDHRADVGQPNFKRIRPIEKDSGPFKHFETVFKHVHLLQHACIVQYHDWSRYFNTYYVLICRLRVF